MIKRDGRTGRSQVKLVLYGASVLLALLAVGCATVTVRKVPTPTQYIRWTDDMQRRADRMEGIRFYLPRPFVNVFESFPIRTDVYIAEGEVSPDGQYVAIKNIRPESGLAQYAAGSLEGVRIAKRDIMDPSTAAIDAAKPHMAAEAKALAEAAERLGPSPTPGVVRAPEESKPRQVEITGKNVRAVTNDNSAFAFQPLRGNFDILYLPDFEEQYVVSSEANLGNAEFAVNMGQGWSLQGFNSLEDNSALTQRIFEMIDTAMKLARMAATRGLDRLLPDLAPGAMALARPHAGREMKDGQPGTPVSLKIMIVHYAAKGLCPVIKPRELQERVGLVENDHCFLDLFKLWPRPAGVSEVDSKAIKEAQRLIERETGRFTVPRYPYQYVSFNTFRYLAIEVIRPNMEPFHTLYDKTATTGDRGDAQVADLEEAIQEMARRLASSYEPTRTSRFADNSGRTDSQKKDGFVAQVLRNVAAINRAIARDTALAGYKVKSLSGEPKDRQLPVTALLESEGDSQKADQLKALIKQQLENQLGRSSNSAIKDLSVKVDLEKPASTSQPSDGSS